MKILITGAQGQLGLELQSQLKNLNNNHTLISTGSSTLDITDIDQVEKQLTEHEVDIVINCAAYTAVDQCEKDIETAYRVNALGPKNLAIICQKIGAKLVHLSTDYVFDGEKKTAYKEDDPAMPQSIYGKSKLLGEEYIKDFCSKYFIIRTAWLYGQGDNFVETMLKLSKTNKELSVVSDQLGSPTSTKDLALVIINLMETQYYGTFHGVCRGQCSWYDFAKKIFELKNIKIKVNKITTGQYSQLAKRPKDSVMDNFMLELYGLNSFRHWEEALEDYLIKGERNGEV